MKTLSVLVTTLTLTVALHGQVPPTLSYQGHVAVDGANFNGNGNFKFAIVNSDGTDSLWSNDGTSVAGGEPINRVPIPVSEGIYSVALGEVSLPNMTPIPAAVFTDSETRLRIWFDDGVNGSQLLSPDQPILSVAYAMMAELVPDASITAEKIADGAIDASKLADGAVSGSELAPDSVSSGHIIDGEVQTVDLADGAVTSDKIAPNSIESSHILKNTITSADVADVLSLETLNLGGVNWDGTLKLFSKPTGGGGGFVSSSGDWRGYLEGDAMGSALGLFLSNGSTGAVLTSRSTGGRLQLWDSAGTPTTLLGALNGGGNLNLWQIDGNLGISLDGDRSTYNNQASSGGEISVYSRGGSVGLLLDGDHSSAGRIEVRQSGVPYVDIFGRGANDGGEIRVKGWNGANAVEILGADGSAQRAGGDSGGRITLYQSDSDIGAVLYGSADTGAGALSLRNSSGDPRLRLHGGPESGSITVHDQSGTETFQVLGAATAGTGSELRMRNGSGNTTVELDGDWTPANGGTIRLFKADGTDTIRLQADYNGEGRIITQVLEITGGSDLSEQFEVTAATESPVPGMLVSIDPQTPGELIVSSRAYDRTAAGVISGAGGVRPGMLMGQTDSIADGQYPVALSGRVYCHVDASYGAVEPGDLITTSDTPGHGMRVSDHSRAQGAIVGKAMTRLESGQGLVLVLVSLQ